MGEIGKKKEANFSLGIFLVVCVCVCIMMSVYFLSMAEDSWDERLYVPTMIQKINEEYFIVDCWQHRILYSSSLNNKIEDWQVLTDESYIGGHTIASDGELYVLDNTDNSQVLCYARERDGKFYKKRTIGNIENRPHYVIYDEENALFYVISSSGARIYVFQNRQNNLELVRVSYLKELENAYVRSINIIDGNLYTVSGNNMICVYEIQRNTFCLLKTYAVPDDFYGMNQITKWQGYFYVTVNTDKNGDVGKTDILQMNSLEDLSSGNYTSLYSSMEFVGQPYFITSFDDRYYVTQISAEYGNGIKSFAINDNVINDVQDIFYWGDVTVSSRERYKSKYAIVEDENAEVEEVDLFLFCGQSNMSGKGEAALAPKVEVGYEFRAVTDPAHLYRISEPFGINQNKCDGINDSWPETGELRKYGGMVSAFANSYYNQSGVAIVGVSCSEGATVIDEWLPGTRRFQDLVNRCQLAEKYLLANKHYVLQHKYFVWCQGESDGDNDTEYQVYYDKLEKLTDTLVDANIVEKCFIIQTGNRADKKDSYFQIQAAQENLCKDSENCILISDKAKSFLGKKLMKDQYHYTQEGYNILGTEAGENVARYTNSLK